ncbi:transmembrane protease serine 5 isoform X8 [Ictidomys tridecemlineatus]|uniref:transmembrane protease serine 5 isoform X8 n=1 Tax=Ictidomys tridecemlineatus TaxID=43179 RepID=UPI000B53FE70|nr:transmembrane protease serine 5 isoform X8 [Ictidomys tridecemlineatus]KAG3286569.1 transmembrane protease, serine 5, transcript variant X7 [Ictidomys tridecemlineatus]
MSLMLDDQVPMEVQCAEKGPAPAISRAEPRDQPQPSRPDWGMTVNVSKVGRWCSVRRGCVVLGALGLLAGAGVGSWLLVLYLWPAASQPISGTLQDEEMMLNCSGASNEEVLLPSIPKAVSFRINSGDFLLEVKVRARPAWLLVCHEGWNPALGMRICQSLGHLRLIHHKGVNLSDTMLNSSQKFARLSPSLEGFLKEVWQLSFRLFRLSSWRVHAGLVSHSTIKPHQGAMVEKIISHPLYSAQSHDYDVALLRLRIPLNFSETVGAVCLPAEEQHFPSGSQCWVSGWGHTDPSHTYSSDTLQDTVVPLLSTQLCNSSCIYSGALTPRMMCAGYLDGRADACQGDSGGPLVCPDGGKWHLVGVVSWGRGCAEPNHPGVYAKVAEFLDWIHKTVQVH